MSRCWGVAGIARNLSFCRRQGDWWFFCPEHRRQPLYALFGVVFVLIAGSASIYACKYGATTQDVEEGTKRILQRQEDIHHTGRPNVFFKGTKFYEPLGKSDKMAIE